MTTPSGPAVAALTSLSRRVLRWILYAAGACAVLLAAIVLAFAIQARFNLPALHAWHRLALEEDFHANRADAPRSFDDYRRMEDRLFAELHRRLLDDPAAADPWTLGRYNPRSATARLAWETEFNRSYELVPPETKGAVLLVHGLSDSPYSMRTLGEAFRERGYYVLVLRLPGHGTIPSGLVDATWRDWYAAVTLAAKHAARRAGPGRPFVAGGYSTGAALLTLHALRALDDRELPRPDRLYLISPAIGISRFAVLTNVLAGLSFVPWFEKSTWIDVLPEYDPYKYNSFPVNAANQIYALTRELRRAVDTEAKKGRLAEMPRVVVFQSVVDATVTAEDVVGGLLGRLPARGHELVVFDVNRHARVEGLLAPGPIESLERLRSAPGLPFRLTIIGNRPDGTSAIAAFTREAGARELAEADLPLEWPLGVFSLGHVALPFPPDDPVYGLTPPPGASHGINLGAVAARGESGALVVPLGTFSRLRCNPFFDVIRAKIDETLTETEERR